MTQPAEQQPARDDLYDALDQSWYHWGPPGTPKADSLNRLIDAHAAEIRSAVLREAADAIDAEAATGNLNAPEYGSHENVLDASALLRRMAEEARS